MKPSVTAAGKGLFSGILAMGLAACSTPSDITTVKSVELTKFMGSWYVIANVPTYFEKGAHNAVETYSLDPDGTIQVRFTFRKDSFDGKEKVMTQTGHVFNKDTNAEWRVSPFWPLSFGYLILGLDAEYQTTLIGMKNKENLWIMARTPTLSPEKYSEMEKKAAELGYDISKIEKVPQQPR